jgi:hypothetical protein
MRNGGSIMSNEQGKVVYTTTNYEVRVTTIKESGSDADLEVYGIFNINTGVREAELRGYPHALKWADNLEIQISEMIAERVAADAEQATVEEALGEPAVAEVADEYYGDQVEEVVLTRKDAAAELDAAVPAPELS